ncbi:zonular occludens toxin domain-containing protein [Pseudomonas sp.]|uniref:zonular occludens toxin domain-containing protein n=1 Tax=Pseudomonas sp. TaxID=306 RepID=UPI003341AE36
MPIKIYWGPPGSYKTSAAVMDEVARCAREGRVLVTNIRGLNAQRIRENVPDAKPEALAAFDVIHLRMDNPEDLHKLRTWWQWAPFDAYFVLDEVQAIYPPDWNASKLHDLDATQDRMFPSGEVMPKTVTLAFDMHRHGNWDFCFTTPNIKKVLPAIRGAAECAYKHKNLAILGVKGRFAQFMHLAEDNGNTGDMYGSRWRKIPQWVFACYDSTGTGAVSDSKAGWNIFANPRLLLLFGVLLGGVALVFSIGLPSFLGGSQGRKAPSAATAASPSAVSGVPQVLQQPPDRLNAPSERWRLVSVIHVGQRRIFHVASGRTFKPVVERNCRQAELGWVCRVEDGIATLWSGPDPIVDLPQQGPSLTVQSPLTSS